MLKIGDFSRLARVTVKTLRHYAEIGLLKPAWVDRFTGYRYYSLDQLPRLNRILALKDLGLTLEQIARVMEGCLSPEELRGMLHLKQAELQQKLTAEQMRLARVAARLRQIEQEGALTMDAVAVRTIDPLPVIYMRDTAPTPDEILPLRLEAVRRMRSWLAEQGITPAGPWLALYTNQEYTEQRIPIETAVALNQPLDGLPPAFTRIMFSMLPPLPQAAVFAVTGGPDALPTVYANLYAWAEQNGYKAKGYTREVYLSNGKDSLLGTEVIEVQLPVELIAFSHLNKESEMEPEIIESRELLVVGKIYEGTNENQEISELWDKEIIPRLDEIKRVDNMVTYGVCDFDSSLPNGGFRYLGGAEVASPADCPPGMQLWRVPAGKYAVFKHIGALETLSKTYDAIYNNWMPKSAYKRANRPDLEVYNEEFHDFSPDSVLYLWVPIEEK